MFDFGVYVVADLRQRGRIAIQARLDHFRRRIAVEWWFACQHMVQGGAEAVYVGPVIAFLQTLACAKLPHPGN